MILKGKLKKDIIDLLAYFQSSVSLNVKEGYTDLSKDSEDYLMHLLNKLFGISLVNLNEEKKNHPAIDLGDKKYGCAYQVTATADSNKVNETLKKFKNHELDTLYQDLYIISVTGKQNSYSLKEDPGVPFNEKHILDMSDITSELGSKTEDELQEIKDLLVNMTSLPEKGEAKSVVEFNWIDASSISSDLGLPFFLSWRFTVIQLKPSSVSINKFLFSFHSLSQNSKFNRLYHFNPNHKLEGDEYEIKQRYNGCVNRIHHEKVLIRNGALGYEFVEYGDSDIGFFSHLTTPWGISILLFQLMLDLQKGSGNGIQVTCEVNSNSSVKAYPDYSLFPMPILTSTYEIRKLPITIEAEINSEEDLYELYNDLMLLFEATSNSRTGRFLTLSKEQFFEVYNFLLSDDRRTK